MRTLYQMLNCLPGPHGRQRHLKVGRGPQKYVFLYDGGIHFRSRTRIGTMHMFIGQFFKGKFEFLYIRSARACLRDPGGPRERHTHGLRQGVFFLNISCNTCL